jgi:ABC-type lipoprotein release transport system permease subunit
MVLLAIGTAAGAGLAILAGRFVSSVLYGLKPWDPAALGLAIGCLAAVSLAASWIPARRAALVPPSIALRED